MINANNKKSSRSNFLVLFAVLTLTVTSVSADNAQPLEAVRAAADAARAAAEAAQAAAEAAKVAAAAAHVAVTGTPPPFVGLSAPVPVASVSSPAGTVAVVGPGAPPVALVDPAPASDIEPVVGSGRPLVLSALDIAASGHTSLSDFLRDSSVSVAAFGVGDVVQSAGNVTPLGLRSLGGTRSMVLLNGRRLVNSAVVGGSLDAQLDMIPLSAVARVEVLGNDASARYGENAIAGALNIVTHDAVTGLTLTAGAVEPRADGSMESYYGVTGGLGGERANVWLAAERVTQDGTSLDGLEKNRALVAATLKPLPGIELYAQGVYGDQFASAGSVVNPDLQETAYQGVAGAQLTTGLLGGVTVDVSAQHGLARTDYGDEALGKTRLDAVNASVAWDGLRLPGIALPIDVGAQERRTQFDTGSLLSRRVSSVFGGATLTLLNALSFDYRLREDTFGSMSDALVSERFGIDLALLPGVHVFGSYADGYGLATFDQQFAPAGFGVGDAIDYARCEKSFPGVVTVDDAGLPQVLDPPSLRGLSPCQAQSYVTAIGGNALIEPEYGEHWRAGVRFDASPIAISLQAYRIEMDNIVRTQSANTALAQEWLDGASPFVQRDRNSTITQIDVTTRNAGRLATQGAELEFRLGNYLDDRMPFGVRIIGNFVDEYFETQVSGLAASAPTDLLIPELSANVGMRYRPFERAMLQLNAQFIGEASNPDRSVLVEEWFSVDAALALQLPWKGALTLGVRNLLDQQPPAVYGLGNTDVTQSRYRDAGFSPFVRYQKGL